MAGGGGSSSFQELPQGLSSQSSLSWVQVWPSALATDRARLLLNQMINLNLEEAGAERKSVSVATPANTQTLPLGSDLGPPGQWGGPCGTEGWAWGGPGRAWEGELDGKGGARRLGRGLLLWPLSRFGAVPSSHAVVIRHESAVDPTLEQVLPCPPGLQSSLGALFTRGRGSFTDLLLGGLSFILVRLPLDRDAPKTRTCKQLVTFEEL